MSIGVRTIAKTVRILERNQDVFIDIAATQRDITENARVLIPD